MQDQRISFQKQAMTTLWLALQTYVSPEADRALCRAQGGSNSQGAIYRVQAPPCPPCAWQTLTARPRLAI